MKKQLDKVSTSTPILACSPLLLLLIDSFVVFGKAIAPQKVAQTSCSILPLAKISAFLLPGQLIQYASTQCTLIEVNEPTISIIALATKFTAALALMVICLIQNIYKYDENMKRYYEAYSKYGSFAGFMQNVGMVLLGLSLFCLYYYFKFDLPIAKFRIDVLRKLEEDFVCCVFFLTASSILNYSLMLPLYVLSSSQKNPNSTKEE